jgi:hypothetical protein
MVQCIGGTNTAGSLVPTFSLTLSLNSNITSRLLPNGASEALLFIDEPETGQPGPGPLLPEVVCDTPQAGAGTGGCIGSTPGVQGLYVNTTQGGSFASQCTALSGGVCTAFGPTPNVFMGVVTGNQVTFNGIPIVAPADSFFARVFRVTNVRLNVAGLGTSGVTPVKASISLFGAAAPPLAGPVQTVGFTQTGLTASVRNAANSGALASDSLAFQQCISAGSTNNPVNGATLRFAEPFATAYRTRLAPTVTSTGIGPLDNGYAQSTPGVNWNAESGLVLTAGGGTAGLSNFGTRLKATFHNVPPGVNVFITTTNYASATGLASAANPPGGSPTFLPAALANGQVAPAIAQLVQDETTSDDHGQVPTATATIALGPSGTPTRLAPVTLVNGSGEAVWEVIQANPSGVEALDFGVYFQYVGNVPPVGTGTVNLSYAQQPAPRHSPRLMPCRLLPPCRSPGSSITRRPTTSSHSQHARQLTLSLPPRL